MIETIINIVFVGIPVSFGLWLLAGFFGHPWSK